MILFTLTTIVILATIVYFYAIPIIKVAMKKPRPMIIWDACKTQVPLGSTFIGDLVMMVALFFSSPYSANMFPVIQEMDVNKVVISIRDLILLRNPFSSIHAAALTNLGELTCALNVFNQIHGKAIAIPTGINIKFLKKARGKVTATCECDVPTRYDDSDDEDDQKKKEEKKRRPFVAQAVIKDKSGETCATVDVSFLLQFK